MRFVEVAVQSFRTDDVDEEMAIFRHTFYEHRIKPLRNGPLGFSLTTGAVGALSAGILSYGREVVAESVGQRYSIAVPLNGAFQFEFGRNEAAADPSTGAIVTSGKPVAVRGCASVDDKIFLLGVDPVTLENHLRRLLGREDIGPINFSPSLDLRSGHGAHWWQLTRTIALSLESPDGLGTHPMVTAELSGAVLTSLLLAADHAYRDALDAWTRPVPPSAVQRALDIIELHAHEPITIVEIAEKVGSTVRALQAGFRKYLQTTPSEQLKRVRMERAHAMLVAANPNTATVAEIAKMWGFFQLGRFAGEYRKHYGVLPRVTLRDG